MNSLVLNHLVRFLVFLNATGGTFVAISWADEAPPRQINFNRDIRPILSDKCFHCHGPDAEHRKADLRFDTEEGAKADLGGYRAIEAGSLEKSELVTRIISTEEGEQMPPADSDKKLSADEIARLKAWIAQGAQWSRHWAYVSPTRHKVPAAAQNDWPLNWIDHFVLDRLNREGLSPSSEANRVTLIRRLSFDLTGLPPTPQQVDRFVNSKDPKAYGKLVDQLLASDRYGERMATYWLDLVRYADTVGYHGDQPHNISPYRDYVIQAYNDNMPFDRFTREQLAGDLVPHATVDQKVASGYNRMLQTTHEGGLQPKEYLAIYAADRVRNLSNVWMGATLGCAQCHDHKYDPYTAKDFYSMAAIFADIDETRHFKNAGNSLPTQRAPEIKVLSKRQREQLAAINAQIKAAQAAAQAALEPTTNKAADPSDKAQQQIALRNEQLRNEQRRNQQFVEQLKKQRDTLAAATRATMIAVAIKPRIIRLLPRGNWLDESGPVMTAQTPEFLPSINVGDRRLTRDDLASWLTSTDQGVGRLTARVQVNRFWYLFFGTGISKRLDDFGGQGAPPVHPELLDNLAMEFVASGWDVKHLVKLIVMSRAYRQSSLESKDLRKRDPYNQLVARQSRFRLPAEMLRDNALAISGLLVEDYGGASVNPYQPPGYYRHLNFPQRKYKHHKDSRQWRRGVYVHWQRQFLHPMLKAFDAPSREECTAERPRSNTPVAALVMLNDPTFVEAARVFAAKIIRNGGENDNERFDYAMRWAISRKPDAVEQKVLNSLLQFSLKQHQTNPQAAAKLVSVGLAPKAKDLDQVQLAAWTAVARVMLNLSETSTRN